MIGGIISKNLEILMFYLKTYPILKSCSKLGIGLELIPIKKFGDKPVKVILDDKLCKLYNDEIQKIGKKLKEKYKEEEKDDFTLKILKFFSLRVVLCILAYYNMFYLTILASLLQFIILPYSFMISFFKLVGIFSGILCGHFIVYPLMVLISSSIYPNILDYHITINNNFIILFFSIDFLVNLLYSFWTPKWKVKKTSFKKLLTWIFYGTLNSRSFFIILYLLIRGTKIYYFLWAIDAVFRLVERLTKYLNEKLDLVYWTFFYHQHRISHLPHVYQDAHKFHHYIHDCSPFDSHLYGLGAPEEWHLLMLELLPSYYFGILPPSLNYFSIKNSHENRIEHIRIEDANDHEIMHADHHVFHLKNFCWAPSLEMYFETSTNNFKNTCDDLYITKELVDDKIIITYIPYNHSEK